MNSRQERLSAIKRIIETKDISTQEELMAELEKLGYDVTQATVSRDISDLGLLKARISMVNTVSTSRQIYSLPEVERLRSLLNEFMTSVDRADNLIVIRTNPGTAQAVAAAIDSIKWIGVLGTVGGDDTILVITRSEDAGSRIAERLTKLREERAV
ncbi:MAG: arginine repressor [Actinobacteria bacterium]|nr:arginine repressor [Actinomycetota bacterium]